MKLAGLLMYVSITQIGLQSHQNKFNNCFSTRAGILVISDPFYVRNTASFIAKPITLRGEPYQKINYLLPSPICIFQLGYWHNRKKAARKKVRRFMFRLKRKIGSNFQHIRDTELQPDTKRDWWDWYFNLVVPPHRVAVYPNAQWKYTHHL